MCFVFPVSVWDVRWKKLMSSDTQIATMMAKTQESGRATKKKKNEISIHSAAAVSHLCLHAINAV